MSSNWSLRPRKDIPKDSLTETCAIIDDQLLDTNFDFVWLFFGKYYHLRVVDFRDQNIFEDAISVLFDRISFIKCLFISKLLLNTKDFFVGKPSVVGRHLVDNNLFLVAKHFLDTKYFASRKC